MPSRNILSVFDYQKYSSYVFIQVAILFKVVFFNVFLVRFYSFFEIIL